jgi:transposase
VSAGEGGKINPDRSHFSENALLLAAYRCGVTEREAALQKENDALKEQLAETQRQLDLLVRHVFGKRSERTPPPADPAQMDLELEAENAAIESEPPARPAKAKGGSRKGRKVRAALLPEYLPVEESVLIPMAVQAAPGQWREIGREVSERLERIPGKLIVQRLVRPVYVSVAEPYAAPVTAPAPPHIIEGGMFGLQFMTDLVLGKYLYHQPLYRQAKGLEWESGVKLSAATLCQTIARLADAAEPVVRCMAQAMWRGGYVQMDLTPVRCLSREHAGGSFLGQMWVTAVPGGDVLYTWDQSKAAAVAERIVPESWRGLLQTDGGSELGCYLRGGKARDKPRPDILRAACWAHVRRKFFEAAKAGCPRSARLLKIINVLYRIESVARESGITPEQRAELRQRRSARVLRGLHRRMEAVIRDERPRSPVAKACLYAKGQWPGLLTYLRHGEVEIDNNSVENAIRPCALGKKNYLFIGDVGAGQRSAVFYSLLGSCLRRGLNPRDYLHWLFERLPVTMPVNHHTLTPAAYAAALQPAVPASVAA